MGFFENDKENSFSGFQDRLDLIDFEETLIKKFNDADILGSYKAKELGIILDKNTKEPDLYSFDGKETLTICPEPLDLIKDFDDVSDNAAEADRLFREKLPSFRKITLNQEPMLGGRWMWRNKTLTGVNLRPGNLNDDRDKFDPVKMCDDNVHGLIVGRTGSGKSVFINTLILSLITEYAPWELDLYLADFKKVELSRYMNNKDADNGGIAYTPHINACAATSEIRYVVSLIDHLVKCMKARQDFFAVLGVTKIQEFRKKYQLVLPRVLLIVDEFQQLFTEATGREQEEIQTMLNAITKLGRATGFHLIFASQEMSGTLRGNTLANFKIRMALPCNQQISVDILGNSQAVNLERGYVLINTDSGDELKNRKYRVPFIETDEKDDDESGRKTDFYRFLDNVKLAGRQYERGLRYKTASQKFYQEDLQESEDAYCRELDGTLWEKKNKMIASNDTLFDAVVLGKTVLYSPKRNDKVSFCLEKGRNKGVMIACPDADHAAGIRKLLAENLFRSDSATLHFGVELNDIVFNKYNMEQELKCHLEREKKRDAERGEKRYAEHRYFKCDVDKSVEYLELFYYLRFFARKQMEEADGNGMLLELKELEKKLLFLKTDPKMQEEYHNWKKQIFDLGCRIKELDEKMAGLEKDLPRMPPNPMIPYLEKCSEEIVLIQADRTKVKITELKLYRQVTEVFAQNVEIENAAGQSVKMLDQQIEALEKKTVFNTEKDRLQNTLAIQRNKIFRRAVLFFRDMYCGKEPEKTGISDLLGKIYVTVEQAAAVYRTACESEKAEKKELYALAEQKVQAQDQLEKSKNHPPAVEVQEKALLQMLNSFIAVIFEKACDHAGYKNKKEKPPAPAVSCHMEDGTLCFCLDAEKTDAETEAVAADILSAYMETCRSGTDRTAFQKTVFWINGLDEMSISSSQTAQMVEVIKNAINQNILVVAIITSELKDMAVRKAFDYAFITGNIEKFYTMFDMKYTRQPLDSIVVNFGVRSKGIYLPFKMYKPKRNTEVERDLHKTPYNIDDLLDADEE